MRQKWPVVRGYSVTVYLLVGVAVEHSSSTALAVWDSAAPRALQCA